MGLSTRDYQGDPFRPGGWEGGRAGFWQSAPVCKAIILVCIGVILLQFMVNRPATLEDVRKSQPELVAETEAEGGEAIEDLQKWVGTQRISLVEKWLSLDMPKVLGGQVWRTLTMAFCHSRDSLWHILFNMLFLWWFGRKLEQMYGSREFLCFYLAAVLVGSLFWIGFNLLLDKNGSAIGASGAIMAVLVLFAMHFPRHKILLMLVLPIEIRWFVALAVLFDIWPLLQELSGMGTSSHVAHAVHLGGLAFGFFYGWRGWRFEPFCQWISGRFDPDQRRERHSRKIIERETRKQAEQADDVDSILAKISERGVESLSAKERKILERASEDYRDRDGSDQEK